MSEIEPISTENIIFKGKLIEVVQQEFEVGSKKITFEWARRAPGTRIILDNEKEQLILIIKEYRNENKGYDYRIPGGKMFDRLDDYNKAKNDNVNISDEAIKTIIKEAKEEVGLIPIKPRLIKISKCGATVEWDLYYFSCKEWTENLPGQALEDGELITFTWLKYDEVKRLCIDGTISEDRTRGVLLSYLLAKS